MVRPRKLGKNFVPQPWISESDSDSGLDNYNVLSKRASLPHPKPPVKRNGLGLPVPRNDREPAPEPDPDPEPAPDSDPDPAPESDTDPYDSESDFNNDINDSNYADMLEDLSKSWLLIELQHNVSSAASDAFWKLAMNSFSHLMTTKEACKVTRKTPQFTHLRRKLRDMYVPPIQLEIGYKNKETEEEIHITTDKIPISKFPKSKFQPLYEIATVQVIFS